MKGLINNWKKKIKIKDTVSITLSNIYERNVMKVSSPNRLNVMCQNYKKWWNYWWNVNN